MGFFSHHDNKKNSGGGDIDYERLRHDLIEEFLPRGWLIRAILDFWMRLKLRKRRMKSCYGSREEKGLMWIGIGDRLIYMEVLL